MFCDSAEFYILKPYNALKNIFCCIKILFFILMFCLVFFNCCVFGFVSDDSVHDFYDRIVSSDVKISDINLDVFFLNSAFIDSGSYEENQLKENLFENEEYKNFKTIMELDSYKYITILQDDTLSGYYIFLSNAALTYEYINYHISGSRYEDRYYLKCDSEFLYIWISPTTCTAPQILTSTYGLNIKNIGKRTIGTKKGVFNYFYYFSTCGIKNSSGSFYNVDNKITLSPNNEISKRLPILSLTHDFFIMNYNTFLPYLYLFNGSTSKVTIGNLSFNVLFISSSNFSPLIPFGKLYTHELINGKFKVRIFKKGESDVFYHSEDILLSVVSKSQLDYSAGGIVPFFNEEDKILYYQVYLPSDYSYNDFVIWMYFDNEGAIYYYSSFFHLASKISTDIEFDEFPSGDVIEDFSGDSSGDIFGGLQNSINDLNNNITNGFDNLNNTIQETSKNFLQNLLDSILGFFIPADDYFSNYFQELSDWFSDRLGLLYYPIDLFLDFINRCLNINFDNQIMKIGPYNLNFGEESFQLVPELVFDFSTFTEDENLKMIHETYYLIVDGLIIFGLVRLIQSKYEEVFKK